MEADNHEEPQVTGTLAFLHAHQPVKLARVIDLERWNLYILKSILCVEDIGRKRLRQSTGAWLYRYLGRPLHLRHECFDW